MGKKVTLLLALFAILAVLTMTAGPTAAEEAASPPVPAASPVDSIPSKKSSSGLPIPRFVSLSGDKVFIRTGPALKYPIKWVYQRPHMPVEIISEFDTWRKIRDIDGDDGWVHQSLLSGHRSAIVKGEMNLAVRKQAQETGRIIAYLEPNVVVSIEACHGEWCEIDAQGYGGFVERKFLWGIYDSEDFD
jgi:SH3-like domain-containing protein